MTFLESPRFPDSIARGAEGGPMFMTELIEHGSGFEQRNIVWPIGRHKYSVDLPIRAASLIQALRSFFWIAKGMGNGFRFKDWLDFQAVTADGRLGTTSIGTGLAPYQLYKRYTAGAGTADRPIKKPLSTGVTIYRNASPVTFGAGAGNVALDSTTGIATFVPDLTNAITAITKANPGQVTAVGHTFSNGQLIYIDSVGGMTQVNNLLFTIANVATDTFTIGVNTTGYTTYTTGGNAKRFPQPADVLTWAGPFDVPVRFTTDWFRARSERAHGEWSGIELIELRLP